MTENKKKNIKQKTSILDKINADDGLAILKMLARKDTSLLKKIEDAA